MDLFFSSPEAQICRRLNEAGSESGPRIVCSAGGGDPVLEFGRSSAKGLLTLPRRLESRFLYDAAGSVLFDRITLQPEYYLTRCESSILAAHAAAIREMTGPVNIVELGSGNATKTDHLLRAWLARGERVGYYPVDLSASALYAACNTIRTRHPRVRVVGLNCDYREAFAALTQLSPVMVTFLGSSIGNFTRDETSLFCSALAASLRPGDFFLLGLDLVKRGSILEAAYNDRAGVTASFTRNIFARMNRELGTSIEVDDVEHVARYMEDREQVEIFARFRKGQKFTLNPPGRQVTINAGEEVQTEISRKFRLEQVIPDLVRTGFSAEAVFTDRRRWFALLLLRRVPLYSPGQGGTR